MIPDYRVERDRDEAQRRAANLRHDYAGNGQKYLGTVFDGGSMAASLPAWFLTYPTQVTGDEVEGDQGAFLTDTANPNPVLVIGTTVPLVGDVLPARMINGFWVAERGGTQSNCCKIKCLPCPLPQKDLTISCVNGINGNGSAPLFYGLGFGVAWTTLDCVGGLKFSLSCASGTVQLLVTYYTSGECPTGQSASCVSGSTSAAPHLITLTASECSPLSLTFSVTSASCPALVAAGFTEFTVTDPDPLPPGQPLMCQAFIVRGCGLTNSHPYPAAIVTVFDREGGSQVATGMTNAAGLLTLSWPGKPGSYFYTVTGISDRFNPFSATVAMPCNGLQSPTLTAADGYACSSLCLLPLKTTLQGTLLFFGLTFDVTLTYNTNILGSLGPGWTSVNPFAPGVANFVAFQESGFSLNWCPSQVFPTTVDCPPELELVWTCINTNTLTVTE